MRQESIEHRARSKSNEQEKIGEMPGHISFSPPPTVRRLRPSQTKPMVDCTGLLLRKHLFQLRL